MRKVLVAFIFIAVFIGILAVLPSGAWERYNITCKNPEAQKLADQIFQLLVRELTLENYKKAIMLAERAAKIEPDNDQLWVELASNCWNYADRLPKKTAPQKKERLKWFDKGKAAAEKALAIKETAGAHFWYGTNLAAGGEMVSIIKSVWMFPHMVKHMKRSEELDPDYIYGGVARFWTEVSVRVPDMVMKMVGVDVKDALKSIETQINRHPLYFENYVFIARYLVRLKRKDDALKKLEFVLTHDPKSIPEPNLYSTNVESQGDARALWKELTGKSYPAR